MTLCWNSSCGALLLRALLIARRKANSMQPPLLALNGDYVQTPIDPGGSGQRAMSAGLKDLRAVHLQQQQLLIWCAVSATEYAALHVKLLMQYQVPVTVYRGYARTTGLAGVTPRMELHPLCLQRNFASTSYSLQQRPLFKLLPITQYLTCWSSGRTPTYNALKTEIRVDCDQSPPKGRRLPSHRTCTPATPHTNAHAPTTNPSPPPPR